MIIQITQFALSVRLAAFVDRMMFGTKTVLCKRYIIMAKVQHHHMIKILNEFFLRVAIYLLYCFTVLIDDPFFSLLSLFSLLFVFVSLKLKSGVLRSSVVPQRSEADLRCGT